MTEKPETSGQPHQAAELLRRAREHLRAGRHAHAEALAEVALAWDAGSDEAMAILGRTALLRGDHARAAGLLVPAVAQRPEAVWCHDLGRALVGLGRRTEAATAFGRAAELAPQDGDIANDLGVVLAELGRVAEAEAAFRRAVALQPGSVQARNNLATALTQLGRAAEAAALPPPPPEPEPLEAAIARLPDDAELRRLRAQHLQTLGRLAEAEAELRVALALAPGAPAAHADLGWVLRRQNRLDEATALLSAAVERWPGDARVLNSLAIAVLNAGQPEAALALLDRAAAGDPDDAEVQHNRAMALLRLGRFAEGWEAYEWRWRMGQGRSVHRALPQPLWTGEALDGRSILLHAEQGLGIRYSSCATCRRWWGAAAAWCWRCRRRWGGWPNGCRGWRNWCGPAIRCRHWNCIARCSACHARSARLSSQFRRRRISPPIRARSRPGMRGWAGAGRASGWYGPGGRSTGTMRVGPWRSRR